MKDPCARCGHDHDLSGGRLGPYVWCWEPPRDVLKMQRSCSCPGYRTKAQQEAWEDATQALGCDNDMHPRTALRRLLELYP